MPAHGYFDVALYNFNIMIRIFNEYFRRHATIPFLFTGFARKYSQWLLCHCLSCYFEELRPRPCHLSRAEALIKFSLFSGETTLGRASSLRITCCSQGASAYMIHKSTHVDSRVWLLRISWFTNFAAFYGTSIVETQIAIEYSVSFIWYVSLSSVPRDMNPSEMYVETIPSILQLFSNEILSNYYTYFWTYV